jgi:ABC-type molybdate transport system ATPase subunit
MIEKYRKIIESKKVEKNLLKKQKKKLKSELLQNKKEFEILLDSQIIIQEVAQKTQNEIKIRITDIVNLAIDSIPFDDPPDYFDIDFTIKRNQTECDLFYVKNQKRMNPIQRSGGGLLDITSFGLQIACWSLKNGKKSNTIILDENFKFTDENLPQYVGEMLQKVSEKLKLQILFITHDTTYKNIANKIFKVIKNNKISEVQEL